MPIITVLASDRQKRAHNDKYNQNRLENGDKWC